MLMRLGQWSMSFSYLCLWRSISFIFGTTGSGTDLGFVDIVSVILRRGDSGSGVIAKSLEAVNVDGTQVACTTKGDT